ncbi:hypothetical protein ABZP36_026975 [Zizania latifolia]
MKPPAAAGNKGGGVNPSIPWFKCQECLRPLLVVVVESFTDKLHAQDTSGLVQ